MKQVVILIICILTSICNSAYSSDVFLHTLHFETDRSALTEEHRTELKNLVVKANALEDYKFFISGHTSNTGDSLYNIRLSEKRSKSIIDYLLQENVEEKKIKMEFHGWNKPVADNRIEEKRRLNRRVEIRLVSNVEKETERNIMPISKLYEQLQLPYQTYCIHPKGDTVLKTSNGTLVSFSKNIFSCYDIPENACIDIRIREVYEKGDMIMANLSTEATMGLLISHGMLELEAKYNNRILELCGDVVLAFPSNQADEEMMWFEGNWNEDNNIVWVNEEEIDIVSGRNLKICGLDIKFIDRRKCPFFICKIIRVFNKNHRIKEVIGSRWMECYAFEKAKRLEERFSGHSAEQLANASREDLEYYISNGILGMNNIDKYMINRERIALNLDYKAHKDIKFKLIIGGERAWLPFNIMDNRYTVNAPKGINVTIMGLKYIDNIPHLALQNTKTGKKTASLGDMKFEPVSIEELKERLMNL